MTRQFISSRDQELVFDQPDIPVQEELDDFSPLWDRKTLGSTRVASSFQDGTGHLVAELSGG